MPESAWLDCGCLRIEGHKYPCAHKEVERLSAIILEQQDRMKKLEKKNDQLTRDDAERGETNAKLNKENERLIGLLKKHGIYSGKMKEGSNAKKEQ